MAGAAVLDVQSLSDIEAIRALKARYGLAVDEAVNNDVATTPEVFERIFTADAILDFPGSLGRHEGMPAIKDVYCKILPASRSAMWHAFHSPLIELAGDEATGVWTVTARARSDDQPEAAETVIFGRYRETYRRTNDGWRISTLRFERG